MPERLVQDDCELRALAVEEPIERSLSKSNDYSETYLDTTTGRILVAHTTQEITNSRPVIITYHDLGLNYVSNFQAFFNFPEFKVSRPSRGFYVLHTSNIYILCIFFMTPCIFFSFVLYIVHIYYI